MVPLCPSVLPTPLAFLGVWGPAFLLIPPSFFPYPESFYHLVGGHTASLTTLLVLVPTGGGEWS